MLINCDIGERGVGHTRDDELMQHIDIANIACGGHAGNAQSVEYYCALAKAHGVKISAHLSYPDPVNFGRSAMTMDDKALLDSLDEQYALLSEIKTLKLHGALYNEANINRPLAQLLMNWAKSAGIKEVLAPEHSEVAIFIDKHINEFADEPEDKISVIHEVFLDRRYVYENNALQLMSRRHVDALITNTDEAIKQYQNFLNHRLEIDNEQYNIRAVTGCIHSDSDNSLELICAIKNV